MDYLYCIQSLTPQGKISPPGIEATGALLSMAGGREGASEALLPESCVQINVLEAKTTGTFWVFRFLIQNSCPALKSIQCTLYHSTDSTLDATNALLARQVFDLSRTRGALTAPNPAQVRSGFLLLKVAWKDRSFVVQKQLNGQ